MKILILSKRQYTGKDLVDDAYGRVYELPKGLSELGHGVAARILSYRPRKEGLSRSGEVDWHSVDVHRPFFQNYFNYLKSVRNFIGEFKPDVIWASSDILHAHIASKVATATGTPFIIDLYDNYESFGMAKIPGFKRLLRSACRNASGLSIVSQTLCDYVNAEYSIEDKPQVVLGNAISRDCFYRLDKAAARKSLGIPKDARAIGTAGSLASNRGIETLYRAFLSLSCKYSNLWLIVAGPRGKSESPPQHERVLDLGELSQKDVVTLYNCLDLGVVSNRDSAFGRYCYPQKLFEMIACGIPVLAASVGEVSSLLSAHPHWLYEADSVQDLTDKIELNLNCDTFSQSIEIPTWQQRAKSLEQFLCRVAKSHEGFSNNSLL